ncbi:hypothetical protein L6164_012241 [Bauhinia variegata]|uniref:Uncharacterized protein n=1 Tax=Bauhinia variegata TaxID=167791 RepID=A0ACB9P8D0_BAUVA|nr:hypothetical protein L6164_012241 [Bauhinia variegata]
MKEAQTTIPHLFRCPISLDLFQDPVTLCTGHTYDRSSIEKWLAAGNLTCPVTMQKLHDPSIVPNHTLRHLIDRWLQLGSQFDPGYSNYLAALKQSLESEETTLENKLQALEKIRVLSDEYCSLKRSCFFQLGLLPLLLELVFGRLQPPQLSKHDMQQFIEVALCCILKLLHLGSLEPLNMLKQESKIATFLLIFEQGNSMVRTSLCDLMDLAVSSSDPETHELCFMLGNCHKLVSEIVVLVDQNFKAGIKGISALCSLQSNRENLVKAGAIDGIIKYIISGCERERRREKILMAPLAMAILEKLVVLENGKEALINNPNGIKTLVKMVFRVSDQECSEGAVGSLVIVCRDFGRAREEAIAAGILTQLLLLLQSRCGDTTKTKARLLLRLLRSKLADAQRPQRQPN